MPDIETISELVMVFLLGALWLVLLVTALYDLVKQNRSSRGARILWGAVVVVFSIIGPVLYLAFGREESGHRVVHR